MRNMTAHFLGEPEKSNTRWIMRNPESSGIMRNLVERISGTAPLTATVRR